MGDKHSGIVSLSKSCFLYVGGIPDSRILHLDCTGFFFNLFLIETTQLMMKNNASLASKLQKALGQNLTSPGTGQDPAAATVRLPSWTADPQGQLSVGFWSAETADVPAC